MSRTHRKHKQTSNRAKKPYKRSDFKKGESSHRKLAKPSKSSCKKNGKRIYRPAFTAQDCKINAFCRENNIYRSSNGGSYYFNLGDKHYRVSNHTVEQSNAGAYDKHHRQTRPIYHNRNSRKNTIHIIANKYRIMKIYSDLVNGYRLDNRGYRIR